MLHRPNLNLQTVRRTNPVEGHLSFFIYFFLLLKKLLTFFAGARYQALLIPDCPGALNDLAHSGSLHRILSHFISQQSESEVNSKTIFASGVCVVAAQIWTQVSFAVCRACLCSGRGSVSSVLCYRGTQMDLPGIQFNRGRCSKSDVLYIDCF